MEPESGFAGSRASLIASVLTAIMEESRPGAVSSTNQLDNRWRDSEQAFD